MRGADIWSRGVPTFGHAGGVTAAGAREEAVRSGGGHLVMRGAAVHPPRGGVPLPRPDRRRYRPRRATLSDTPDFFFIWLLPFIYYEDLFIYLL